MMDYRTLYSQLPPLRQANLIPVLMNLDDGRSAKGRFLSVQRLNDLSATIQIARMNLSYSVNEDTGSWVQYVFALNALLWYNSCDDYICQYVYLSEHAEEVTDKNYFVKLQNLDLNKVRNDHEDLKNLYKQLKSLRECANTIKHRMPILDRTKQKSSIGILTAIPNPNSRLGFSVVPDSQLSTDIATKKSFTIDGLLDILFKADDIIYNYVETYLYSQFNV